MTNTRHAQTAFGAHYAGQYLTTTERSRISALPVEQRNAELAKLADFSVEPLSDTASRELDAIIQAQEIAEVFADEPAIVQLIPPGVALQFQSSYTDGQGDHRSKRTDIVALGLRADGSVVALDADDLVHRPSGIDDDGTRSAITAETAASIDRDFGEMNVKRRSRAATAKRAAQVRQQATPAAATAPAGARGAN